MSEKKNNADLSRASLCLTELPFLFCSTTYHKSLLFQSLFTASYIASILFLQTLAVFLTILYLDTYFNPEDKPVPRWLQTITSSVLSKLACVDCKKKNRTVSPNSMVISDNKRTDSPKRSDTKKNENIVSIEEYIEDKVEVWDDHKSDVTDRQYSWKEIALLLDKVTMYIYLIFVTGFTVITTCIMLVHYCIAYTL